MSKSVGEYTLTTRLGSGSFATVYLGKHTLTNVSMAIKVISRERLNKKLTENLESEISIMRNFKHPNIVELSDIKKSDRNIYLVLEYCEAGDLHKYIRSQTKLSEKTSRIFMSHLSGGMKFLWERNLIHRDLKPQNLLLSKPKGEAFIHTNDPTNGLILKIADFGFARHLESAKMAETLCGSPLYMAPEILEGRKYDAKADLWSVGAILFEMVVGRPPYGGSNPHELLRNINRKSLVVPEEIDLSEDCLLVLRMLLKRQPVQRASFQKFFASNFVSNFEAEAGKREKVVDETVQVVPSFEFAAKSSNSNSETQKKSEIYEKKSISVQSSTKDAKSSSESSNKKEKESKKVESFTSRTHLQQNQGFQPLTLSPPSIQPTITFLGSKLEAKGSKIGIKAFEESNSQSLACSDDFVLVERLIGPLQSNQPNLENSTAKNLIQDYENLLKVFQNIEITGKKAVLLAQLGDSNVVNALKRLHSSFVESHWLVAKKIFPSFQTTVLSYFPFEKEGEFPASKTVNFEHSADVCFEKKARPKLFENNAVKMSLIANKDICLLKMEDKTEEEVAMRLFGEALVLYLKSLGMIKSAITCGRQAMEVLKLEMSRSSHSNMGPSSNLEFLQQMLSWGEGIQNWLSQQFSAILGRSEQCNEKLKSSSELFGNECVDKEKLKGSKSLKNESNELNALSAEHLILKGAVQLSKEAAACEFLGEMGKAQKSIEKAALLIETVLTEGCFSGTKRTSDDSKWTQLNFDNLAIGGFEEIDREVLQKYLDSLLLSAETLRQRQLKASQASGS